MTGKQLLELLQNTTTFTEKDGNKKEKSLENYRFCIKKEYGWTSNLTIEQVVECTQIYIVKIDLADFSIVNEKGAIFETADGMGMSYAEGVYTFAEIAVIADIDASGKVDSNDLVYVRQMLLSKLNKVYDINGDGVADIRDLVRIKKLAGE